MDSIPTPPGIIPLITSASYDYLATLGIQLRQGRMFTEQEEASGARVAVVTENMARGIWGEESALGRCLLINDRDSPCWEVVGIAEPSHLMELTGTIPWQYYVPLGAPVTEDGARPRALLVQAQSNARDLLGPVRRELRALDPAVRFAHVRLQQDLIDPQLRAWRLGATMFSLFGLLALIVAAVGLYSVLAFTVARRTRELGIRSAMGASREQLLGTVLRRAVGLTAVGILLGLAGSLLSAGRLEPLLFDTSPRDPLVLMGVVAVLLVVALGAGTVPAWSAARTDPVEALRTD
jgi:hypothetical protein